MPDEAMTSRRGVIPLYLSLCFSMIFSENR
jgi:hypothetical protein